MRVLAAGATGAIGRPLVPALVAAGHEVIATTRSPAKLAGLREAGAEPVVLDGLDALAVGEAVAKAEPEVIIHEMTAIPAAIRVRRFDASFAPTNALRTRGTDYLLAAAGVRRFIAQSYAGYYARTGGPVKSEADALDAEPPAGQRETVAAGRHVEQAVLGAPLEGIVLRYGSLYGPGASEASVALIRKRQFPVVGAGTGVWSFLHVADAATATTAAVSRAEPGIYNVVDDDPAAGGLERQGPARAGLAAGLVQLAGRVRAGSVVRGAGRVTCAEQVRRVQCTQIRYRQPPEWPGPGPLGDDHNLPEGCLPRQEKHGRSARRSLCRGRRRSAHRADLGAEHHRHGDRAETGEQLADP